MSDKQAIKAQSMSYEDGMKQRVKDDVPLLTSMSDDNIRTAEALRSAILRMGNAEQRAQSAEAKYDAAVGQVARFVVAIPQWKISVESAVAKLDPQKCSFAERNRLIRLIDYMEEALASSVPLVAARDARVRAGVLRGLVKKLSSAPFSDPMNTVADWIKAQARVEELAEEAGTQAH